MNHTQQVVGRSTHLVFHCRRGAFPVTAARLGYILPSRVTVAILCCRLESHLFSLFAVLFDSYLISVCAVDSLSWTL